VADRPLTSAEVKLACIVCSKPAELLLYEPDGWVCRSCSDNLGREAMEQTSVNDSEDSST
jgi:hypothetical protein